MNRLLSLAGAAYLALAPMTIGAQELPKISDMRRADSLDGFKELLRQRTAELNVILDTYEKHKLSPTIEAVRESYEELQPLMDEANKLVSDDELDDMVTSLLNFGAGHEDAFGEPQEGYDSDFHYDVQSPDLEETKRTLDSLEIVTIDCDDHTEFKDRSRAIGFEVRDYRGRKDREARDLLTEYERVEDAVIREQVMFSCDDAHLQELEERRAQAEYTYQQVLEHPLVEDRLRDSPSVIATAGEGIDPRNCDAYLAAWRFLIREGRDTSEYEGLRKGVQLCGEGVPNNEGNGYEWAEEGRIPLSVLANPGDCVDDEGLIKVVTHYVVDRAKKVMCCDTGVQITVDESTGWILKDRDGSPRVEYPGGGE